MNITLQGENPVSYGNELIAFGGSGEASNGPEHAFVVLPAIIARCIVSHSGSRIRGYSSSSSKIDRRLFSCSCQKCKIIGEGGSGFHFFYSSIKSQSRKCCQYLRRNRHWNVGLLALPSITAFVVVCVRGYVAVRAKPATIDF